MDQGQKCYNIIKSAEEADTSYGFRYVDIPCGEKGMLCDICKDKNKIASLNLKHHYCGEKAGFYICSDNAENGFQCQKCKTKDKDEVNEMRNN